MANPLDLDYNEAAQLLAMRRRNTSSLPPEPQAQPDQDQARRQRIAALLKQRQ